MLSIIIPSYNYAHFLPEALDPLVHTDLPIEIVLIDDASTDGSQSIIRDYAAKYPCIRPYFHENNQGVVATAHEGALLAHGEYIHFFAADDFYLPHTLEKVFNAFAEFPEMPLFFGDQANCTDPSSYTASKLLAPTQTCFFEPQEVFQLMRDHSFQLPGQAVFMKRSLYFEYGPLDQALYSFCDAWINMNITLNLGLCYIPAPLVVARKHGDTLNSRLTLEQKRKIWERILSLLESDRIMFRSIYKTGVLRFIGLRSIYKTLLFRPHYWRYLFPIARTYFREKLNKTI